MTAPVIAVLDNDPAILSLMHELLTEEGDPPLLWHASAGGRTHALLRCLQPALVILDLWSEVCDDGWTFLQRLCDDADTPQIPVVIVTGESALSPEKADMVRTMRSPVVTKPFDRYELLASVTIALTRAPVARSVSSMRCDRVRAHHLLRVARRGAIEGGRRQSTRGPRRTTARSPQNNAGRG